MSGSRPPTIVIEPRLGGREAAPAAPHGRGSAGKAEPRTAWSRPATSPTPRKPRRGRRARGDGRRARRRRARGRACGRARRRGAARRPARRARQRLRPGNRASHRTSARRLPRAARRHRADARPRRGQRAAVCLHRLDRLRLRREPHRERGAARPRQPGLRCTPRIRALAALAAGALPRHARRRRARASRATRRGRKLPLLRGRHEDGARPPTRRTACSTWSSSKQTSKLRFLANLPKVFAGTHVDLDEIVSVHRAREVEIRADRPFDVYADGEPITSLPATVRLIPGALRVIAPRPLDRCMLQTGRARSRGPSARCPGSAAAAAARACRESCCCGWSRTRSRELGASSTAARWWSARRTARPRPRGMIASVLAAGRHRGGAQPRRREHAGRRRDRASAATRRRGRIEGSRLGLFEVDEAWLGDVDVRRSRRTRSCSATSSATSSTATASSSGWPTNGPRLVERARGPDDLRAERRRSARRRPRPRPRRAGARERVVLLRRRGPLPCARRARARLRRQALPPLRRRVPLRGRLSRASRRLRVPAAAATRARGPPSPPRGSSCTACRAPASPSRRPPASSRCRSRSPASTTSTTRSRRPPAASSSGIGLEHDQARARVLAAAFGRAERIDVGGRDRCRSC